jgi:hypothetical protein
VNKALPLLLCALASLRAVALDDALAQRVQSLPAGR